MFFFSRPRYRGGVIFSLQFVCVFVCVSVRLSCDQNSSQTDEPIRTRFSLNGCLLHWLEPYEIGDLDIWYENDNNEMFYRMIGFKAAFQPCVNVYIYKPINRSEWTSYVPWVIKFWAKFINNKKKVSTDRASMILRKHEQSVLQSMLNLSTFFFICLYAIHIHWKCAKLKKIKAWKLYMSNIYHTKFKGER